MHSAKPIALVIESMGSGGAQRVVAQLMDSWISRHVPVTLITFQAAETDFYPVPPEVNRIVLGGAKPSSGLLSGLISNLRRVLGVRKALQTARAPVTLAFLTSTNIVTILASLGLPGRLIISERNDPVRQNPGVFWSQLRRLLYRRADAVTANTTHAIDAMHAYVASEKLAMIPNPVVMPADGQVARPSQGKTLLTIGRLVPQKCQSEIIAAFDTLASDADPWTLKIIGEGPERAALEQQLLSARRKAQIELPGRVTDPGPTYASAAIFILASNYEGTPNTLLEAMSYGLPVVVPDCLPGALEVVTHNTNGMVYASAPQDRRTTALSECIATLIGDPHLRDRLGQAGRQTVSAYSPPAVAALWDHVLWPNTHGPMI